MLVIGKLILQNYVSVDPIYRACEGKDAPIRLSILVDNERGLGLNGCVASYPPKYARPLLMNTVTYMMLFIVVIQYTTFTR